MRGALTKVMVVLSISLIAGGLWPALAGGQTFTNSISQKFVLIPPGTFTMGSRDSAEEIVRRYGGEAEWYMDEHPVHQVTISRPFYMQTTEVTVGQWREFIRATGYKTEAETGDGSFVWTGSEWEKQSGRYWVNPGFSQGDDHPVTCVSWNDVQAFVRWLNDKEKTSVYRLPTESEWEYAARAGSGSTWIWGESPNEACRYANVVDKASQRAYNWSPIHECDDGYVNTAPVGRFQANAFGLHDITGNVWEWCQDWYGDYSSGLVTDPRGAPSGEKRVLRGGSWDNDPRGTRVANRTWDSPDFRCTLIGFRVARDK
ncbi:MAG: formylglycine-generating enzyme family protein [Thermodesulfobacteriota bacterium]